MSKSEKLLSKVPEVTLYFWIIKVLCTTVGETASDFLNVNLGLGLVNTSIVMGIIFLVVLFFQFRAKRYIPALYWTTVVLISVFGTLVTDNLTDGMGVPLEVSTIVFSLLLGFSFALWYTKEGTLSIHSIFTRRREAFYWLVILFTFALGTASGDLTAEALGLGYPTTGLIVAGLIASFAVAWKLGLDSVLAFWSIYILTRPLGASLGDYLTQPQKYGGLGLGATVTSVIFGAAIVGTVILLTMTKKDQISKASLDGIKIEPQSSGNVWKQVVAVICLLTTISGFGYHWRQSALNAETGAVSSADVHSTTPSGA